MALPFLCTFQMVIHTLKTFQNHLFVGDSMINDAAFLKASIGQLR
jgi:FMN phosphatase YigB (HAD superfamily)